MKIWGVSNWSSRADEYAVAIIKEIRAIFPADSNGYQILVAVRPDIRGGSEWFTREKAAEAVRAAFAMT